MADDEGGTAVALEIEGTKVAAPDGGAAVIVMKAA